MTHPTVNAYMWYSTDLIVPNNFYPLHPPTHFLTLYFSFPDFPRSPPPPVGPASPLSISPVQSLHRQCFIPPNRRHCGELFPSPSHVRRLSRGQISQSRYKYPDVGTHVILESRALSAIHISRWLAADKTNILNGPLSTRGRSQFLPSDTSSSSGSCAPMRRHSIDPERQRIYFLS